MTTPSGAGNQQVPSDDGRPSFPLKTHPPFSFWLAVAGTLVVASALGWRFSADLPTWVRGLAVLGGVLVAGGLGAVAPISLEADAHGLTVRRIFGRRHWPAADILAVLGGAPTRVVRGRRRSTVAFVHFRTRRPMLLDQRWIAMGLADLVDSMRRGWGLADGEEALAQDPHAPSAP